MTGPLARIGLLAACLILPSACSAEVKPQNSAADASDIAEMRVHIAALSDTMDLCAIPTLFHGTAAQIELDAFGLLARLQAMPAYQADVTKALARRPIRNARDSLKCAEGRPLNEIPYPEAERIIGARSRQVRAASRTVTSLHPELGS